LGFAAHAHFVNTCAGILDLNVLNARLCLGRGILLHRGTGGTGRERGGLAPCQATGQQEGENGIGRAHLLIVSKAAVPPAAGKMPA
jgi:hypothetical protein